MIEVIFLMCEVDCFSPGGYKVDIKSNNHYQTIRMPLRKQSMYLMNSLQLGVILILLLHIAACAPLKRNVKIELSHGSN